MCAFVKGYKHNRFVKVCLIKLNAPEDAAALMQPLLCVQSIVPCLHLTSIPESEKQSLRSIENAVSAPNVRL